MEGVIIIMSLNKLSGIFVNIIMDEGRMFMFLDDVLRKVSNN